MSLFIELFIIAVLVSVTAALIGNFLIVRGTALTSFALSHSVLFGIMVMFLIIHDLDSPFLFLGAAAAAVLIVLAVEFLSTRRYINSDAALGIVYLSIFAIGILMVANYAANTTLSVEGSVTGNLILSNVSRIILFGRDWGPKIAYIILSIFIANSLFLFAFYKELKMVTFNPEYAIVLGYSPTLLNAIYMIMVSLTIISTFKVAGIILVVSLMIIPPATAYLLTKSMSRMIYLSGVIALGNAVAGFLIGWNIGTVEIASVIAMVNGAVFLTVLIYKILRGR